MVRRIIAGILGMLAAFGSLLPLGYAFEIFKDFKNPDISFWPNLLGELLMCSIAIAGIWIGMRFLRFATSGQREESTSWTKPVLLGIGLFFPGFLFSLPITMIWVSHGWPRDDGKIDLALEASVCVGVATAIISTMLLLRRRLLTTNLDEL